MIFPSFTSLESVARCGRSRRNSERKFAECTLGPNTRTFASWNLQKRCSLRTPHTNRSVLGYGSLEELHRAGFVGSTVARSAWNAAWLCGTDETRFMSVWRPLLVPWRVPLFHMVRLDDPDNLMALLGSWHAFLVHQTILHWSCKVVPP